MHNNTQEYAINHMSNLIHKKNGSRKTIVVEIENVVQINECCIW